MDYELTDTHILLPNQEVPDGDLLRVTFSIQQSDQSLTATQKQHVALLAAAELFERLSGLNITDNTLYQAYGHRANALRDQYITAQGGYASHAEGTYANGIIEQFRYLVDDFKPQWQDDDTGLLWKNQECVHYLDSALIEYTTRKPIYDEFRFDVVEGVDTYSVPKELTKVQRCVINNIPARQKLGIELPLNSFSGQPVLFALDVLPNNIRIYPTPDNTYPCHLFIERRARPISSIYSRCDIDREAARHLIYWMAYLAYTKQDAETADLQRAQVMRQHFDAAVGLSISDRAQHEKTIYHNTLTMRVE